MGCLGLGLLFLGRASFIHMEPELLTHGHWGNGCSGVSTERGARAGEGPGAQVYSSLFERWLATQRGNILQWDDPKCQNAKSCLSSPFSEKAIWAPGGHWRLTNTAKRETKQSGKAWIKGTPKSFALCSQGGRTFLSWGGVWGCGGEECGRRGKEELNGTAYRPEVNY